MFTKRNVRRCKVKRRQLDLQRAEKRRRERCLIGAG